MADGDNVGKISLDMEISGDLSNQISKAAEQIGERIEASLKNIGDFDFKGVADTIGNTIEKSINSSMKSIQNSIESTINKALANVKGIKIPVDFEVPSNISMPNENTETKIPQPRAPPIPKVTSQSTPKVNIPKIDAGVNLEAVKSQIDNLTRSLDITNAKIEQQMEKLADLKASYNQAFDGARKNKLQEQILKTEEGINRLTAQSDKAGFKLADLDAQFATLENVSRGATAGVDSMDSALKRMSNQSTQANKEMKNMSNSTKDMGNSMNHSYGGLAMITRQFFTWMVVLPLIMKGLTAMTTFLGSAFMTNTQFANSLNQIKSNLLTAFMPIYQAVLPALNSLMSALATVTAYIASFTSQLFGKTYSASFGAAQAMQQSIGAYGQAEKQAKKTADSLGGVSKSAKSAGDAAKKAGDEAKKGLAGFDGINKLSDSSSTATPKTTTPAGDGITTPITPMANMAPIEAATQGWVDKFKNLMASLWKPFQEAWAAEGQNTINAAKHALQGIEDLLGAIGKSFYTVWTNGTGERILVNLLKILQDILNIIGDIGVTFANAWNKGNIGTQIVQSLANAFNNVLSLIDKMLQSIRHVWAEEGPTFANIFMQALKATTGVIENVTQKLGWIWDHGGQHAFEGLVKLGLKVGESALFIYTNFVTPFVNWFVNMISPAIAKVLDVVGSLADKMSQFIGWLMGSGKPVLDIIVKTVGSVYLAFKAWQGVTTIAKGVKGAIDIVKTSVDGAKTAVTTLGANFSKLKGFASGAIDVISSFGKKIAEAAISVGQMTLELGKQAIAWIAQKAQLVATTLAEGAATIAQTALNLAMSLNPIGIIIIAIAALVTAIVILYNKNQVFRDFINGMWAALKNIVGGAIDGIKGFFQSLGEKIEGVGTWIQNTWNKVLSFFGSLPGRFAGFVVGIGTTIQNGFNNAINYITELPGRALGWGRDFINGLVNGIKSGIGSVVDAVSGIADTITSYLHFSVPDQGSLTQYESWMPDFVKGLASGINSNKGLVTDAISGLSTDMSVNLTSSTSAIQQPQLTMVGNNISNSTQSSNTGSIDEFKDAIIEAMVEAIKELKDNGNNKSNNGSGSGDLIFKVGDTELGRIAIAAINKVQRQAGVTLLKV